MHKPMSEEAAQALANGGSANSFTTSLDDSLKANFGADGQPMKISMATKQIDDDDDPPPVMM